MKEPGKHASNHSVMMISTKQLHFDPLNPRFPPELNNAPDHEVLERMLRDERLQELMQSIGLQGFFAGEPILVVEQEPNPPTTNSEDVQVADIAEENGDRPSESNRSYIVVEGNRRLAAAKLLNRQLDTNKSLKSIELIRSEAENTPTELPCIVFAQRDEVLRYLGFRHITGIKSWGPLQKARYLDQLREAFYADKQTDELNKLLAKEIGSRSDYVGLILAGLAVYTVAEEATFFGNSHITKEDIEFSLLTTALSYSSIYTYIGMADRFDTHPDNFNRKHVENIFNWLFAKDSQNRTVLGESRNLSKLASVIGDEKAVIELEKTSNLDEAFYYTNGPAEAVMELLNQSHKKLQLSWTFILKLPTGSNTLLSAAEEIFDTARTIRNALRDKLDDN